MKFKVYKTPIGYHEEEVDVTLADETKKTLQKITIWGSSAVLVCLGFIALGNVEPKKKPKKETEEPAETVPID